ncbi:PREDICTED: WEB family protein At2g17940-like isoform X2 [Nicotiana attenuata]|uniref:WEB family protein At2g17940-like isoform X2 n=1 Tax=Nicotiana attenuata TaxID=49451 RepID=UPI000904B71F|nr:PREDICTED: WEB family protein At2g17940-like isoform X2 [Nicotiana attenuata]
MERELEGVVVRGRVEIDMRQPFRSVKEAVMLFGEKVLAGEIHAKQLKETKASGGQNQPKFGGAVRVELEETKQSLQKAKEEGTFMAHCLQSLKEELELTRREIQQLKTREPQHKVPLIMIDPEIEELKFIEQPSSKVEVKTQTGEEDDDEEEEEEEIEFQKKRSVKFASPPLLTKVIAVNEEDVKKECETSPSQLKKKLKRKPLIPLIGALFSKKKGNQEN